MTQLSRKESLAKMRWRYAQRGLGGKSRLLDEICEVCDYERKHAITQPLGFFWRREILCSRPLFKDTGASISTSSDPDVRFLLSCMARARAAAGRVFGQAGKIPRGTSPEAVGFLRG